MFEEPRTDKAEPPYPEKPDTEKPQPENPQQSIYTTKNNKQNTTTPKVVVEGVKEKQIAPSTIDIGEDLKAIVEGTPFERVDYQRWLKRPDFLDQIDKLVQTYAGDFSKAERPQALVMNVMKHGAIAPDGYVPHRERQAQAKAAAAKAAREEARKTALTSINFRIW